MNSQHLSHKSFQELLKIIIIKHAQEEQNAFQHDSWTKLPPAWLGGEERTAAGDFIN